MVIVTPRSVEEPSASETSENETKEGDKNTNEEPDEEQLIFDEGKETEEEELLTNFDEDSQMVTITIFLVAALIIVLSIPLFCIFRCLSRRRKSRIDSASSH